MAKEKINTDQYDQEAASVIAEACKQGKHTCRRCGRTVIPLLFTTDERKQKVKATVESKLGYSVEEGYVDISGNCDRCNWEIRNTGLRALVWLDFPKRNGESKEECLNRLKQQLEQVGEHVTITATQGTQW